MDNFEYSMQISDRDWEDFYSTAEECDLMQVSLATAEELLLSDTEQEDVTCSIATSKPKFIRVSLCPPVVDQREPQALQATSSPPRHSAYKWIGSNDDVLSGSEDEEEFGSVARFLCQKETLLSKKLETEHRANIPGSQTKDDYVANTDQSQDNLANESLVECMRSMTSRRILQSEWDREDIQVKITEKRNPSVASNGESEREHPNDRHDISAATNDSSSTIAQLLHSKDSPDIRKDNQSCMMVKGSFLPECILNGNIPGANDAIEDPERCYLQNVSTLQASLAKDEQHLSAENEKGDSLNTKLTLYSPKKLASTKSLLQANVMDCDTQDGILHIITKDPGDSSAVQQNISALLLEDVDLSKIKSNTKELDTKVSVNSHGLSFDHYRLPIPEGNNPIYSPVPDTTTEHTSRTPPTPHQSPPYRSTSLTLPEMYDFFFDDVSEPGIVGTAINMASGDALPEAAVYTPDMYEYFFVEEDEHAIKNKDHKPEKSSTNADQASSPAVVASWPEACEFFFADGPQHHAREGVLFSIPPSKAQRDGNLFQSMVPQGIKAFTVQRTFYGRHERLIPHENFGTSEETNEPTTGTCKDLNESYDCINTLTHL